MRMRLLISLGLGLFAGVAASEPLVDGDASAGEQKAAACATCHGPQGKSTNPQWPKLAGQHAPYIVTQLKAFKSGERENAIMAGQAGNLSEQDMKDLAAYYAQQPIDPGVADESLVERGEALYRGGRPEEGVPACSGCHGPAGMGNPAAGYPAIAGQHAQYLRQSLKAYRDDQRAGYGKASVMVGVADELSDADIEAVAAYVQGLKPRQGHGKE